MPVLINELVFKGTVAAPDAAQKPTTTPASPQPTDLKRLVETCVEEVLRILEQREER